MPSVDIHASPSPVPESFFSGLADVAAAASLPHFRGRTAVDNKDDGGFDPVTAGDRDAESAMRVVIGQTYPDHGIVGEEAPAHRPEADAVWVLDPIDGTRAFIAGIPVWMTLIGLISHNRPVAGMASQPFTGERYFGDGRTARYTGPDGSLALKTRSCPDPASAVMCTTDPNLFTEEEAPRFRQVERAVRMARYGTDAYAYCLLAAGCVDAVVEAGLKPYDIVALIPIIEGAGGMVTTWTGEPAHKGGRIVAAGDPRLHSELLKMLA